MQQMGYMKYISLSALIAFMLSVTAFAKNADSGTFTLDNTVQVGSTQLAPGNYKAEWSGPANAVKVEISQRGKTVATTEGRIKSLQQPSPYSAVIVKQAPDNSNQKAISEIDFNHRSEALVIGGE
jgi:hypothetical protein